MFSVLILTFNEEANIGACISSLPWRTDVQVLDSGSSDRTTEIATSMNAIVTVRVFDDYAQQRNAGLSLQFRNEWIVMLDADERMTSELAVEMEREVASAGADVAMYSVRRRDMFMGRWLKRSSGYPTWFPRVLRRGRVKVEREINETYVASGTAIRLRGHLDHYPFRKGMDWWFERHNRYSSMEAELLVADRMGLTGRGFMKPSSRRAALKAFAYRLPFRPYLAFIYLYFVRGGFIDGRAGWTYAQMRLAYEIMINAKCAYLSEREQVLAGLAL